MAPAGTISVGIPRRGVSDWYKRGYSDNGILPFNQRSGIDVVSSPAFEACTLSFSADAMRQIAVEQQVATLDRLEHPEAGDCIGDNSANRALRHRIHHLMHADPVLVDDDIDLELALLLLQSAAPRPSIADKSTARARALALGAALGLIEQRIMEPPTVRELCVATKTPARTLNRAFRERFGVGPKAYVNRVRLSRVRNSLLTNATEESITDVANHHGFWHMGQFARDYKKLFGELPSQTRESS
jgi:AraC-like DNA-binding protein